MILIKSGVMTVRDIMMSLAFKVNIFMGPQPKRRLCLSFRYNANPLRTSGKPLKKELF